MPDLAVSPAPPPAEVEPRCIHALFERQARATPDRIALVHGDERVPYAALNARANRVAHRLRALGVGPETPVALFLPRTPDLVAAMLGVLKAGGAYVPLDPAYPAGRVAVVLDDTRAPVVLTHSSLAERLPEHGGVTVVVDADEGIARGAEDDPEPRAGAENLAYVIYTSGSTGRPKGVLVEHRSAVEVLHWLRDAVTDEERGCALGSTSVCFDVSVAEVFGTLCWGGTLVLVENALSLAKVREPVRLASMVPTAAAELLRQGAIPPTLRTLALGGEPVTRALADALYAGTRVERILNLYGPTEDTTYSTCALVPADADRPVTIGRAVRGSEVRVVDEGMRVLAEAGAEGELFMAGAGVTRGYLGRPALTAERYLPDPASPLPGARMYRTGDRGRLRQDGEYECLGRMDRQVKVRGFRVEPGEVEAALAAHPAVAEAAVGAVRHAAGDPLLVAWTAPAGAAAAELRAFLAARLPDYMVPGAFVQLPALPRTPNGKLDRLALPAPAAADRVDGDAYRAPRTPVEEILAGIWAQVLGMDRVGAADDFFALSGHSLRAAQIVARVRGALGVELPLTAVFQAPTVRALAAEVERAMGSAPAPAGTIEPVDRGVPLPLTPAQEAVWFFEKLSPGMRSYQFQAALRFRGSLDVNALRGALREIVRRHEIFRTVFREVDGQPMQLVQPPWEVELRVEDAAGLSDEARERRYEEEFARPFDVGALPLARWTLFRTARDEHVLLSVEHHLIHDGWSFGVFLRELTALYAAFARGEPSPLPEPRLQFGDFAVWQRAWARGDEARRGLEFWKRKLAGAPPSLDLPTDFARPPRISFAGRSLHLRLPPELACAADAFSRAHGVTLYMTLAAAFQALLARYTGQEDFALGGGAAGRTRTESEELIGMIVNVVPMRADVGGDPGFRELVGRVRQAAAESYPHQDVPFADIVDAVQPDRGMDRLPIFQAAFNIHHAPYPDLLLPGVVLEVTEALGNQTAKFDLHVIVIPRAQQNAAAGEEVTMIWEYATDLFRRDTVERMWGHYQALLASLLADPERPVTAAPLMDDAERRRVLDEWSRAEADYPRDATLHALFREQARRTPDAPAVDWGGRTTTYGELDAASDRLGRRLAALALGPEPRVGVAMERSAALVTAMLGVLKAGAAFVPLDAEYPAERLAYMLADSAVGALVVADAVPDALAGFGGPVLRMSELERDAGGAEGPVPQPFAAAESLASVIYTSGSTGDPKGVGLPHRGLVRLVRGAGWVRYTARDRVAQTSTASFDAIHLEVWGALLNGGCLVGIDREVLLSPAALRARLREGGVTLLFLTTPLFNEIGRESPELFEGIPQLVTGGETMDPEAARRVLERARPGYLANLYGPTENSTLSTAHAVHAVGAYARSVPIGRPLANSTAYVLDGRTQPCPAGVPGELYVGGDGVARGYLGRPGMTAERFVPDPFGAPGSRLYRTGDRARWVAEGALEFLGRMDQQVKVRGFRVEPGEIESALRALPDVLDAAVAARGQALAGYVVPREGAALDAAAVRAALAERLPPYMVPSTLTVLDALPRTPSGKVDRRALPEPAPAPDGAAYEPPATDDERAIAAAWAEVLGVERVGATDGFFALGGHSLRAVRIAGRIEQALGVRLPVSALFETPTVRGLAERVAALRAQAEDERLAWLEGLSEEEALALLRDEEVAASTPASADVIRPVDRTVPLPLAPAQEAVWFFEKLSPGMRSYQFQAALRFRGTLDVDALRRTLTEIVRRHEIFRTVYREVGGQPMQLVQPPFAVELPVEDASHLARAELERRYAEEFALPFDVGALPLARWTLYRTAAEEHVLLCVEHHLVHDGWSFGVFLRELTTLYAAFARGEPSPLPEPRLQFGDFAVWQRAAAQGERARLGLAFWKQKLAGAPPSLDLPTDFARPPRISFRGRSLHLRLPPELARAADAFSRARDVTLYMTLSAAFQALLARYTGQEDFVLGGGSAARTRPEAEDLIGMMVNVVPLRADVSGDPDFLTLVRRVRRTALETYPHQDIPFADIVDAVQPDRTLDRLPIFQYAFNIHHAPYPDMALPGVTLEVTEGLGNETAKFDLQVIVIPRAQQNADAGDEVTTIWEYATDLFRRDTVERMAAHYQFLLASLLAAPERPVSAAPLADEPERRRVLKGWSSAPAVYPRDGTLHGLFREQARRAPDAPAIDWGGRTMTYAELDAASDRVARRLAAFGLQPEARVGLAMERSAALVAVQLGVLKAGCAFVPLDTEYPAERLAFVLEDSDAAALVVADGVPDALARFGGPVLRMAELEADGEDAGAPEAFSHAESLACILYTSGSTGTPKGVALAHRGYVRLVRGGDWARFGPGERVGQASTTSFDPYQLEVWGALLNGGCLVGIDREQLLSPPALAARLREGGVSTLFLTTVLFNELGRERPETFAGVRQLMAGGEAMDPHAVRRVLEHVRPPLLLNGYGPTENSTFSTIHPVRALAPNAPSVPIGRPHPNSTAYVLDRWMRPCPVGVAGEMYVGGDGVARGYQGRPALTAERFVPNPYGEPGSRLYRTGDRVRWLADGTLEFLGRMDQQVKVRGFRVEPGEVEAALRAIPAVLDAVVVPREQALAAYLVPRDGAGIDLAEVRAELARRLPAYMVPSTFTVLEALPKTASGKVDRRALPEPAAASAENAAFEPPATDDERAIAAAWAEVLGVERVGATDGFFALGGHSLRGVRIIGRIEQTLGVRLPVSALFETPTVRGLAERVAAAREQDTDLAERLAWLEGLSDEEALALLEEGEGG